MKFTVERAAFAQATTWAARALPIRPITPVLHGLKIDATEQGTEVSAFDYEISARASIDAATVHQPGTALLPGRLVTDVASRLPDRPVEFVIDEATATISCGKTCFTLHTLPLSDYPDLPEMPPVAGTVDAEAFATAVKQTAPAAGHDDSVPVLCAVMLEFGPGSITMAATDRYRIAWRELPWQPAPDTDPPPRVLIPAQTLQAAAKHLGPEPVQIAVAANQSGEPTLAGLWSGDRWLTTRLIEDASIDLRRHFDHDTTATARLNVPALTEAVKRVAVVAEHHTPVRLNLAPGQVEIAAGAGDEASGLDVLDADFTGEPFTIAFNPHYLLDAITATGADVAEFAFTDADSGSRVRVTPAEIEPVPGVDNRHLLMPIRLA